MKRTNIENAIDPNHMEISEMKHTIDQELKDIRMSDALKDKIRSRTSFRKPNRIWKTAAGLAAVLVLGGATVSAGYHLLNQIQVNDEVLPKLDSMELVRINTPEAAANEFGTIEKNYGSYSELRNELGITLLDHALSRDHPYMQCHIRTDPKSYAMITVNNFILGDTDNYQLLKDMDRYSYDHGEVYYSPVSLKIDLILGEEQLAHGWDTDYLGMYHFVEQYESAQGYLVNLVEDTIGEEPPADYVSKKIAVFVADGIRYTLTGQVSLDTMKELVDTMK